MWLTFGQTRVGAKLRHILIHEIPKEFQMFLCIIRKYIHIKKVIFRIFFVIMGYEHN